MFCLVKLLDFPKCATWRRRSQSGKNQSHRYTLRHRLTTHKADYRQRSNKVRASYDYNNSSSNNDNTHVIVGSATRDGLKRGNTLLQLLFASLSRDVSRIYIYISVAVSLPLFVSVSLHVSLFKSTYVSLYLKL